MEKKGKSGAGWPDFWKKYDAGKLRAIEKFMGRKGLSLEQELLEYLEKLFQRHVPKDVRDYLEPVDEDVPEAQDRPSEGTETG